MQLRVKIVLFSSSQINVSIKLKDVDGLNEMKTSWICGDCDLYPNEMPPFFLIKLSSHSYIHMGLVWEVDDFSLLGYFVCFWWVMYVLAGIGLGKDENI